MRKFTVMLMTATGVWLACPAIDTAVAQAPTPAGVPSPAPDPAFVQNAIAALQQQRNSALDQVAQAQAQLALTQSQLASAKKELEDLKAKAAPEKNFTPVPKAD